MALTKDIHDSRMFLERLEHDQVTAIFLARDETLQPGNSCPIVFVVQTSHCKKIDMIPGRERNKRDKLNNNLNVLALSIQH